MLMLSIHNLEPYWCWISHWRLSCPYTFPHIRHCISDLASYLIHHFGWSISDVNIAHIRLLSISISPQTLWHIQNYLISDVTYLSIHDPCDSSFRIHTLSLAAISVHSSRNGSRILTFAQQTHKILKSHQNNQGHQPRMYQGNDESMESVEHTWV